MLKLILCSGLYPQVAIADEFNNYKRDGDQFFHTKVNYNFSFIFITFIFRLNNLLFYIRLAFLLMTPTIFIRQHQLKQ
jgi:hypothetical protein